MSVSSLLLLRVTAFNLVTKVHKIATPYPYSIRYNREYRKRQLFKEKDASKPLGSEASFAEKRLCSLPENRDQ
jgi:hypothetical protein